MIDPTILQKEPIIAVLELQKKYQDYWKNRDNAYWFYRLLEEVGELGATLAEDHHDPMKWELLQISSICINWLLKEETK